MASNNKNTESIESAPKRLRRKRQNNGAVDEPAIKMAREATECAASLKGNAECLDQQPIDDKRFSEWRDSEAVAETSEAGIEYDQFVDGLSNEFEPLKQFRNNTETLQKKQLGENARMEYEECVEIDGGIGLGQSQLVLAKKFEFENLSRLWVRFGF